MPPLSIYLLQANTALLLFFLGYRIGLRRLTFFVLNRLFLLFGLVFSVVYPLIDFPIVAKSNATVIGPIQRAMDWEVLAAIPEQTALQGSWHLVLIVFWAGVGIMALRLAVQLGSLYHLHRKAQPTSYKGFRFRAVRDDFNPFSFWQTIYLNPARHANEELVPILQHEQIHVAEWHTLDVLLAEWSTVFFWFNPASWLIRQAIKENLEFRVDQRMLETGLDSKNYQYMLVRVGGLKAALGINFTTLTIKKRIGMMNREPSSRKRIASYSLLPVILLVLILPKTTRETGVRLGTAKTAFGNFLIDRQSPLAVVDTPNGTANLVREIRLKSRKAGKVPPTELILFSKNSAGRGMDVYVKLDGDQIEQAKILALAPPDFIPNERAEKPLGNIK
ncbi:hypothetical protein GCM10028803_15090 [Larkinella knui]|uniref:M56 family metallopeptidase n=1 Tax=Larkinella knui TaxID=2025310 RepID=A0A3P1C980_9BACT|nr:M56 family metallopeptidase [Larkinella knui]RRB09881.1 M56 family metallopeptidase [Larkinella knui]